MQAIRFHGSHAYGFGLLKDTVYYQKNKLAGQQPNSIVDIIQNKKIYIFVTQERHKRIVMIDVNR